MFSGTGFRRYGLLLILIVFQNSGAVEAKDIQATANLPSWKTLEFEQRAFFATAKSRLEVTEMPEDSGLWRILVNNSVLDNSEEIYLVYDPVSSRAKTRKRLSHGEDKRFKTFSYGPGTVVRERRDPSGGDVNAPSSEWEVSSIKEIEFPPDIDDMAVTDAYALIPIAQQLLTKGQRNLSVVVHTEFNFYRVDLETSDGWSIDVSYEIAGQGHIDGRRKTSTVKLRVTPIGQPVEEADFSLLGLHGYIIMFFDKELGALLRLRGEAPRIGVTEINLKRVFLREQEDTGGDQSSESS